MQCRTTIACVLRSGGEYNQSHVLTLQRSVRRFLPDDDVRFVCLSDIPSDEYETIPLLYGWPGWWSKIELFRNDVLEGPTIYFDLDTLIVGDISDLVSGFQQYGFLMLDDWFGHSVVNSGMMGWTPTAKLYLNRIYEEFAHSPRKFRGEYATKKKWGDQAFIRNYTPIQPVKWQDEFPGKIVSFKRDCQNGIPDGASIVCFHGKPRPWKSPLWVSSDTPR